MMTTATTTAAPTLKMLPIDKVHASKSNVRRKVKLDPGFVQSIRGAGIIQPLVVVPNSDGWEIIAGHRRREGAAEAGLVEIPCVVREDLAGAAEILAMLVENTQREDLSTNEILASFEQLAAFDLSAEEIASATGHDEAEIAGAVKAARSKRARALVAKDEHFTLSLMDAAAIAEFEEDPAAIARIEDAVNDGRGVAHTISRLRQDAELRAKRQALVAKLEGQKVRVVDAGVCGHAQDGASLSCLYADAEARKSGKTITAAAHKRCPGHAAMIQESWDYRTQTSTPKAVYCCTNWRKHGHVHDWETKAAVAGSGSSTKDAVKKAEERRTTIANNKAWRAATPVRLLFVRGLCSAAEPPKGKTADMLRLFAGRMAKKADVMSYKDSALGELVGIEAKDDGRGYSKYGHRLSGRLVEEARSTERLVVVLFAQLAAEIELDMTRSMWQGDYWGQSAGYLGFLKACGYELSEIEQRLVDETAKKATKSGNKHGNLHEVPPATADDGPGDDE
jgi:ParB family chromosome partitioning protein